MGTFEHYHPTEAVRIDDNEFATEDGATVDVQTDLRDRLYGIFAEEGWASLDGRTLYPVERRPDFVPFADDDALSAPRDTDRLYELMGRDEENAIDHEELIGHSNQELYDQFGISVGGSPTPSGTKDGDRVDGATIATDTPIECFLDAASTDVGSRFELVEGTGAGALAVRDDSRDIPPSSGHAVYEVDLPDGTYSIWGRVRATEEDADSLWLHVDDRDWIEWDRMDPGRTWTWDKLETRSDEWPSTRLDLSGGTHEIVVANHAEGLELDALYLTDSLRRPFGRPSYDD